MAIGYRRVDHLQKSLQQKPLQNLTENLLLLSFALLGIVGMFRHELWRDETQAWLLARDSASVLDLFRNTHYEGHPLLWHYCLYALSRLSHSLLMMQGFNLLIAIGSAALLVKKSPFSLVQKGLMIFGYFSLYEYTLISRSYGLGIFLALLFCALYCRRRPAYWVLVLVLGLLANTSLLGLIMSASLAIALFHRLLFSPIQRLNSLSNLLSKLKQHLGLLFALLFAWLLSVYQIGRALFNPMGLDGISTSPPATNAATDMAVSAALFDQLDNFNKLLQIILKSYLPIPAFTFHFWNEHLLENQVLRPGIGLLILLLSAGLVAIALWISFKLLRKTPLYAGMYAFNSFSMIAVFVLLHRGTMRYFGHLFVFWLVCLWLSQGSLRQSSQYSSANQPAEEYSLTSRASSALYGSLFTGILCLQAFSGFYAYGSDLLFPFSASRQAAQIIQQQQLENLPILGLNQRPVSPVSGYLDRPIYYPEAQKFGSFWDISYPKIAGFLPVVEAVKIFGEDHSSFVAILTEPLELKGLETSSDLIATPLAYVGPSIVEDEAFYLYRVEER
jgi:hypothetical protein